MASITNYDIEHLEEILKGKETYFTAHLLRFLNSTLLKMDTKNFLIFWNAYPDHCKAIFKFWLWTEDDIVNKVNKMRFYSK